MGAEDVKKETPLSVAFDHMCDVLARAYGEREEGERQG